MKIFIPRRDDNGGIAPYTGFTTIWFTPEELEILKTGRLDLYMDMSDPIAMRHTALVSVKPEGNEPS